MEPYALVHLFGVSDPQIALLAVIAVFLAFYLKRRDHRDFLCGQFSCEAVLFEYGGIAPAFGTIKLGNDRFVVFDTYLIDAVFIAVQCQESTVAMKANMLKGF